MIPTYRRNGRINNEEKKPAPMNSPKAAAPQEAEGETAKGKEIRINGYQQVLEMLQIADEGFRSSLLRRLAKVDPELAKNLTREIYG